MLILSDELKQFINQLHKPTAAKCWRMIALLERFQHHLKMPHSKTIGKNLFELRIRGTFQVRLIYTFRHPDIILFYGFIKKTQQIPQHELVHIYKMLGQLMA